MRGIVIFITFSLLALQEFERPYAVLVHSSPQQIRPVRFHSGGLSSRVVQMLRGFKCPKSKVAYLTQRMQHAECCSSLGLMASQCKDR
ncbi:hypothetical protein M758_4G059900 [Ceratodon purpureus]|uniref:Uncharacterized protein n=1 Tax=Ceratodon purpureus TaxID=3225 RepID=A0A8T0I8Y0_CERPU|nr:hypothetical protein KC19_4G058600 [Ceratodon purpureus]KAG0618390.1 hypothetical protein M758_4G059900 [Ceratodon purpureus]